MKRIVVPALLLLLASVYGPAQAQTTEPVAGKDYIEIPNGSPLDPVEGKVVVEEFFNYICPACNGFEPFFLAWQEKLPDYVEVVHIPAAFRQDFMSYARAYYAAQSFDIAEKSHAAVYSAIHREHVIPAEGERMDEAQIAKWYANYGVDADEFLKTMQSFGVDFKIRRATEHMQKSRVASTPSIVVNGKYLVRGQTYNDMLNIADYLIAKEHGG